MAIKNIMIVGAGFMGSGIAQVAAQNGYTVILNDVSAALVERGLGNIEKNLEGQVKKAKIAPADKEEVISRITLSTTLEDGGKADFIIEAAFENFDVKKGIFQTLDGICRPEVVFASNTSSIPINSLASVTKRPDRFIGMHFFSPVPVMRLVEIIRALKTSEETTTTTEAVAHQIKKRRCALRTYQGSS